ncbi:MAG TPA: class I SAM-dependent methyltransferase [Steroidobacteraceae bacterium]|nr:class I SAM-dependent methyltransferase [Steroidobacteraceae bacterium]
METDYEEVTEIAGTPITAEQLFRLHHRYTWASEYCAGKDAVECGCGTGPGLGLLHSVSRSFEAGDISELMVRTARRHYEGRVNIAQFSAEALPFADDSKDVVVLFEAIYYLPDAPKFVRECVRVLRANGYVLIVTANKDLWDFHPSPYTHKYYGVRELRDLFTAHGFECEFFGLQSVRQIGLRQRLLRPVKRAAVASGLMPKTMAGKRWLKRLVFGSEIPMPAEVLPEMGQYARPEKIREDVADQEHKIIYCAARLRQ